MKKLILSLIASTSLFVPALALAANPDDAAIQIRLNAMMKAVANGAPEVYLPADRYNKDVDTVMKLNGINREAAIARIARALIAQNGYMPKPPIVQGYGTAYDPAPHAFRQALSGMFYAGHNEKTNQPVFLPEQRLPLLDSFWYCAPGLKYVYTAEASSCK